MAGPDAGALGAIAAALSAALGEKVALEGALGPSREAGGPAVVARFAREAGATFVASVAVDAALALEAIGRLLGRSELAAPRALAAEERGACAYLALEALRAAPEGWRLVDVASAPSSPLGGVAIGVRAFERTWAAVLEPPHEELPPEIAVVAGTTRLAEAELAALATGDVVFFDDFTDARGGGAVRLVSAGLAADATLAAGVLRLASAFAACAPAGGGAIRAEVARLRPTAAEWRALVPGAELAVACPLGDALELVRADGRPIARAEPVTLDGEVGLRITRVT